MAPQGGRGAFAFLYQSEQGLIDVRAWARGAAPLAAIFLVVTGLWLVLRPIGSRGLAERHFLDPLTIAANLYQLFYIFAVILLAISWVNLSAKRFRDRGMTPPVGLAGIFPLCALLDGALRWLQPQMAESLPRWTVFTGDGLVVLALAWTIAECGDFFARK